MNVTRKRGGRTPLNSSGSTQVPTRFGNDDLRRIDAAFPKMGFNDRSSFIRHAAIDKADAALGITTQAKIAEQRGHAIARKHQTRVLTATEAELFAATADLIGRRTPYVWGGGNITGPSLGYGTGCGDDPESPTQSHSIGFDAGSLAQYLLFRAFEITIPRTTTDQFRASRTVDTPEAGDLVFFDHDYAAVYLGRNCIAEATKPGELIAMNALPPVGIQLRRLHYHRYN
ncbi:C40 family peptidase [Mycobacterium intracellulare]|uniref:NlpC/P60 family protein n=1 Tax=Mycobacterium intracellulare TaxID=1767 RepID=UPI001CD97988|nr:NlpC/P60 family protein [Mycobacterium intracellulare]MCA2247504.1 C40 family peptidase [Mycobacterium intracellulare]